MHTSSGSPSQGARTRYSGMAIALHWILGLSIIGAFGFGLYVEELPLSPAKIQLINWHKWAGICILFGSIFRLLWRFTHKPPALPESIARAMPGWQHLAHTGTHALMYVLFLVVPLLGWTYSSAKGYPVVLFGQFPLPDLVGRSPELADALHEGHELAAFALIGLVVLHVLGALKHQLIDRDGLVRRMLP